MQTDEEGHLQRVQLRRASGFTRNEIHRYAQWAIAPGSQVIRDSLGCFRAFESPAYTHERIISGSGRASAQIPAFNGVNAVLGNFKNAITGTYHAIRGHHALRYLAEFVYRFNRRYDLKAMVPRLLTVAARTPPIPYRLLKLAEPYA